MDEAENYSLKEATNQNNQFRIGLIAISVGISGFLAQDIIDGVPLKFNLVAGLICAVGACVAGFCAWNFSARMFYCHGISQKTEGLTHSCWKKKKQRWHILKEIMDCMLPILLLLSVGFTTPYLLTEKTTPQTSCKELHSEVYEMVEQGGFAT